MCLFKRGKGASVAELGLLAGLIAVIIIGTISLSGQKLNELFGIVGNNVNQVVTGASVNPLDPEPEPMASSCQEWLDRGETENRIYQIDLNGGDESDAIDVYCDMQRKDGGWTLVAVLADDGNNYWTWNNRQVTYDGTSTFGSASSLTSDYQSLAWHDLPGNEVLFTKAHSATDYLYYSTILNGGTLGDRYPEGTNSRVGEFALTERSGTWWQDTDCSTTYPMSLVQPDSDSHGWAEASWGFIWRSRNNDTCNYDDTFGGLASASSSSRDNERHWSTGHFYHQNFDGSAMQVWVR